MKKRRIYKRNQRGVALLFALGVLSLLLIMGLAFVANSLLAQKIANNNSSRCSLSSPGLHPCAPRCGAGCVRRRAR